MDNYPPGFDKSLLDGDDSEDREKSERQKEDDANFIDQD